MKSRVRGVAVLIMAGVIVAVMPGLLAQHPYVVINGASPGNMSAFAGGDRISDTVVAFSLP